MNKQLIPVLLITVILLGLYYLTKSTLSGISGINGISGISGSNNTFKNYDSLLSDFSNGLIKYTPGGITKIIIKTSWQEQESFPKELRGVMDITQILNPGYEIYYFNNEDCLRFMRDYSDRALRAYNKIIPGAFKSDLFRYCVLECYGGCYSDIGHVMKKSFDYINGDNNLVLVKDGHDFGIHNALMCCNRGDILMKRCVDKCCENIENEYYGISSLSITGPIMIGNEYEHLYNTKVDPGTHYLNITNVPTKIKMYQLGYPEKKNHDILYAIRRVFTKHKYYTLHVYDTENNNEIILNTKFNNYYKIMYSTKSPHYGKLWKHKKIYKYIDYSSISYSSTSYSPTSYSPTS